MLRIILARTIQKHQRKKKPIKRNAETE